MTTPVRTKICGITRPDDALAAAEAGADAIGLNFHAASPRVVTPALAAEICAVLPPFVTVVGLFVDRPPGEIAAILEQVPLDVLQFQGDEDAAQCEASGKPYIKALRVRPELDIGAVARTFVSARGIQLDAWVKGVPGGTGRTLDWHQVPALPRPLVLAGGLTADNVAEAIRAARPWAVDVSGGVESAPGIKDPQRIRSFIRAVQEAATS